MKQVLACTTDCTALQNVSKSYVGHCSGTKVTRQAYQTPEDFFAQIAKVGNDSIESPLIDSESVDVL